MLRSLRLLLAASLVVPAAAQTCPSGFAHVTATQIQNMSRLGSSVSPLAIGSLVITAQNSAHQSANFVVPGGGAAVSTSRSIPISAGALTQTLCVPMTSSAQPSVLYDIIIKDNTPAGGGQTVLHYTNVQIDQTEWSFDTYVPPVSPVTLPAANTMTIAGTQCVLGGACNPTINSEDDTARAIASAALPKPDATSALSPITGQQLARDPASGCYVTPSGSSAATVGGVLLDPSGAVELGAQNYSAPKQSSELTLNSIVTITPDGHLLFGLENASLPWRQPYRYGDLMHFENAADSDFIIGIGTGLTQSHTTSITMYDRGRAIVGWQLASGAFVQNWDYVNGHLRWGWSPWSGDNFYRTALAGAHHFQDASGTDQVTIDSSGLHTASRISTAYLPANIVYNTQSNSYPAGMTQTFNTSANYAGAHFSGASAPPTTRSSGDVWFDNPTDHLAAGRYGTSGGAWGDIAWFAEVPQAGGCTNEVVTSISTTAPPICAPVSSAMIDSSIPTTTAMNSAIATAVAPLATSTAVASAISTATAPLATSSSVTSAISTAVAPLATSSSVTSAIASATAPLAQASMTPVVKFSNEFDGQSGSVTTQTLLAAGSVTTGRYRICGYINVRTAGTAGTVQAFFNYADTSFARTGYGLGGTVSLTGMNATSSCAMVKALAGTAIAAYTTVSSATGSPIYDVSFTLEYLPTI